MIRALAGASYSPIEPGDYVSAPSAAMPAQEQAAAELGGPSAGDGQTAVEGLGPARLYCNLGDVTNLAVARDSTCLFTRVSPFGVEGIAQKLAERRRLTLEHARQWLVHVGLENPIEGIEGDPETISAARDALAEGAARLVDELRLSLEYYAAQDGAVRVEDIVVCGPGTTIPGFVERLQRDLGQRFEVGRPSALDLDEAAAARLTLAFGLGLEE
jgi:type IV pilus assembly protein PilM